MAEITVDIILEKVRAYIKDPNEALVRRAYTFAEKAHSGQKRRSGEAFITHPLQVALILAELDQDCTVIAAALLHDVVEDQDVPLVAIEKEFGKDIAELVDGVTKLSQFSFASREEQQAENLRKMFIAMAKDIRVVIIKLADRLHNMRTLHYLSPEQQHSIALETKEIYAPLAHRLGMGSVKWELEDLSFRYLEPDAFQDIKSKVAEKREARENYLEAFITELKTLLSRNAIAADVYGRPKHFYSICRKMRTQNLSFDSLYDLLAVRVIVNDVRACYAVLGIIHEHWKPIQHKFADHIAVPKSNMYQSLHTGVIGPQGRPVEIQIRTHDMHRVAEYGIAAHWRYKEGEVTASEKAAEKFAWLRQLFDWQKEDAKTFMENLKVDLFTDEVFVFTPKGDVHNLPAGATPVDFAYHIHTQVGHRCIGAKVNGKMQPLDHVLQNGDIIEIMTSNKEKPSLDWLSFIVTSGARTKVKNWFHRQQKDENMQLGRDALYKAGYTVLLDQSQYTDENMEQLSRRFGLKGPEELFVAIGHGEISPLLAAKTLKEIIEHSAQTVDEKLLEKKQDISAPAAASAKGVAVVGVRDVLTRLAKCCTPLPGDDIIGVVTKGHGISIHRANCPNIRNKNDLQQVAVQWESNSTSMYPVEIEIKAFDRVGIVKDILNQISEAKTNLREASARTLPNSVVIAKLVVDIKDLSHLKDIMKRIRANVSDVIEVSRPSPT